MKRILVVAAVIRASDGRVLIAKRPQSVHMGGLWEFPGGKVDAGESEAQALVRELDEELGITATDFHPLIRICHDYADKSVELSVWQVDAFEPTEALMGSVGREGQAIAWVAASALSQYEFPAANIAIVAAAKLPAAWRITPDLPDAPALMRWCHERLHNHLQSGRQSHRHHHLNNRSHEYSVPWSEGWLLRLPSWRDDDYLAAARDVLDLAQAESIPVLLHGAPERLLALPHAAGLHMPAALVNALLSASGAALRPIAAHYMLSVAAHNPEQLRCAEQIGADCAMLSPVLSTISHPGQDGLGWSQWQQWVNAAKLPVYALGGLLPSDVLKAREAGGQGVAGISGF